MPTFSQNEIEIRLELEPRYINDYVARIYEIMVGKSMKYTEQLAGIPCAFAVNGMVSQAQILDNGSLLVNCTATVTVLNVSANDWLECVNGLHMRAFTCIVDGEDDYTGNFRLTQITGGNKLIGTAAAEEEF